MDNYKSGLIELMVKSDVLMFGEFTTKSGRLSPYFFNTGRYKTGAQAEALSQYYAALINQKLKGKFDILFGPAYKGIPLCALTAAALFRTHGIDAGYCFNRKEVKDHGEGGMFIGSTPKDGDRIILIEDVITAGTAVREVVPLIKSAADVSITDMVISVDRMEKGLGGITASKEVEQEFGIKVHALVTVQDIVEYLHNRAIDGKVYIDDKVKSKMDEYMAQYCKF